MLFHCAIFLISSLISVWGLNRCRLDGTALGTLISPYCSGLGNLIFVYLALHKNAANEVVENCLTNNWTNLTLVLGIPGILWGIRARNSDTAVLAFAFTGMMFLLSLDGVLDAFDGVALVLSFVLWQVWNLDAKTRSKLSRETVIYGLVLVAAGYGIYWSLDGLVAILSDHIGRFTGYLLVLPNAVLAVYYGAKKQGEMVYASQVGDGHICVPLAVGLAAIFHPLTVRAMGVVPLLSICLVHVLLRGRISRITGAILVLISLLW